MGSRYILKIGTTGFADGGASKQCSLKGFCCSSPSLKRAAGRMEDPITQKGKNRIVQPEKH